MNKNTNKLHFKLTAFNSSMRVTVYAECIYVLAEYLKYSAFKGVVIFFGKMWVALKRPVVVWLRLVAMSTVPVSRNFFNSLLTPCFV